MSNGRQFRSENSSSPLLTISSRGESFVTANVSNQFSNCVRRAAIAIVATGIVAVPTVHAHPSGKLILVPPTDLPATARQTGESMLLYGTLDDKTHLYIEQSHGARLSILDVTDPSHIKDEGSVQLA